LSSYVKKAYPTTVSSSYYSSSTSSYSDVDPSYYSSAISSVYDPVKISATVITTYYVDVCPTGLTTVPYTYTASMTPGARPTVNAYDSSYFTTAVTVCTNCAAYPTTITLTKPVEAAKTPVNAVGMSASAVPYPSAVESKPVIAPVYSSPAAAIAKPAPQAPESYASAPAAPAYPASSMKPVYASTAAPVMSTPVAPVYSAVSSTKVPLIGTETYAAPYAKFTGGAGREMVTLGGVLGAIAFVLFL
jgi:chitinase